MYAIFSLAFGLSHENTTALLVRGQGRWETGETEESRESGDMRDRGVKGDGRQERQRSEGR